METITIPRDKWEGDYVRGSYIAFRRTGLSASKKTMIWEVFNYDAPDDKLGTVSWFGIWRCYAFNPIANMVFEKTCLREIAQFCEELTKSHRDAQAEGKATE